MSNSIYFIFFIGLVLLELLYFRLARHYSILDHPNNRSLHDQPTIRGGGIILYFAAALFFAITLQPGPFFMAALTVVCLIGFIDDVQSLGSEVRLFAQCLAFVLVMIDMDFTGVGYNVWVILLIFIVSVGALNTFNFMDGINGLTGGYGLVALGSLVFVDLQIIDFIEVGFLYSITLALLIFCYFNFRKRAICFAGDVGSMAIGFIIIYLIVKLIGATGNASFVFFLSVYGVDSVLTITQRLLRKENIFKPHKLHLFQVMVNYYGISHVRMSIAYAMIQLLINIVVVLAFSLPVGYQYLVGIGIILLLSGAYVFVKSRLRKEDRTL